MNCRFSKNSMRRLSYLGFFFLAVLFSLAGSRQALAYGPTNIITRGAPATINYTVTGSTDCTGSFSSSAPFNLYPNNAGDNVNTVWFGVHGGPSGSVPLGNVNGNPAGPWPQTYRFVCTNTSSGASDYADLQINDCANGTQWNGSACAAIGAPTVNLSFSNTPTDNNLNKTITDGGYIDLSFSGTGTAVSCQVMYSMDGGVTYPNTLLAKGATLTGSWLNSGPYDLGHFGNGVYWQATCWNASNVSSSKIAHLTINPAASTQCYNPNGSLTGSVIPPAQCPTWTEYCTPWNDPNPYQRWAYDNSSPVNYVHVPSKDNLCNASCSSAANYGGAHCDLSGPTASGGASGSCSPGYTQGACSYRCDNGSWTQLNNTCAQPSAPSTPTGIWAGPAACGTNAINLSWNSSSGATGYRVYRNGSLVKDTAALVWQDTGLTAGQYYTYTVSAYSGAGESIKGGTSPAQTQAPGACAAGLLTLNVDGKVNGNPASCSASGNIGGSCTVCTIADGASSCQASPVSLTNVSGSATYYYQANTWNTMLVSPAYTYNPGSFWFNTAGEIQYGTHLVKLCTDSFCSAAGDPIISMNLTATCGASSSWVGGKCVASALPDLTAGSVSPVQASTGVSFNATAVVTNIGAASTVTGFKDLLQIANGGLDANGNGVNVSDSGVYNQATPLVAGGTGTASFPVQFNSANTYYLRVCADKSSAADANGAIPESNENNNCGAWTPIMVSGAIPGSCSATTKENCVLQQTPPAGTSGACDAANGYTLGNCSYVCSNTGNGAWTPFIPNTCAKPAVVHLYANNTAGSLDVSQGTPITLTWSSVGAASCQGIGFATNNGAANNMNPGVLVSQGIGSQSYEVDCFDGNGTKVGFDTVSVNVGGSDITFTALPGRVTVSNPNVTVSWHVKNMSGACTLTKNEVAVAWPGLAPNVAPNEAQGSHSDAVSSHTIYKISCPKVGGGQLSGQAIVNISGIFTEF